VGDLSRACQYGLRLAELALQADDIGRMAAMRELLLPHAPGHAEMEACVRRLTERLSAGQAAAAAPEATESGKAPVAPPAAAAARLRMVSRPGGSQKAADAPSAPQAAAPSAAPQAAVAEARGGDEAPLPPSAQTAGDDTAMKEALGRVSAFLGGGSAPGPSAVSPADKDPNQKVRSLAAARRKANPLSDSGRRRTIVSEEMNLAWDLQQAGLLTEDHYAAVVRDLTELSSSEVPVTISALHALQFRSFANIGQVLQHVAGKSETPMIPLASFDPQGTAFGNLPLAYMIVQGVIPFESLGPDLLVAMLNPLNERVRCEVQELAGHTCHFFLVAPADFDTTLETVKNRYPAVAALRRQQAEA